MLEKGKKYTYDEIKEVVKLAETKVVAKLDADMKTTRENNGREDAMASLMFSMQNMLVASMMSQMILEKEEVK